MGNLLKAFFYPPVWLINKFILVVLWLLKAPFRFVAGIFSFRQMKIGPAIFFIIILGIFAGLIDYPKYWDKGANRLNEWFPKIQKVKFVNNWHTPHFWNLPFRFGLDLQGGTHLVYDADLGNIESSSQAEAMAGLRDVIERRVNIYGIAEPLVQINKSSSGQYRLVAELAGVKNIADAIKMIGETPYLEFRTVAEDFQTTNPTQLTGKYLKKARLEFDQTLAAKPTIGLEFNDEGAKIFEELTEQNVGKPLAIFLDGVLLSAPNVNEKISGGKAVITGQFTRDEAKQMIQRLNSGALPVPIKLVSQQSVQSTLGEVALQKSLKAGLYAFLAVAVFMILWYRIPGLLAVLALCIYTALTLAVFKLFGVTLTLAGIAGFILSVGMAVDANILIFARMREEFRAGRTFSQSIDEGLRRAWLSIRDSNMTTLLTCGALYYLTTSVVKGFALTLAIGVIISMFTAIFITRIFLRAFVGTRAERFNWIWYR